MHSSAMDIIYDIPIVYLILFSLMKNNDRQDCEQYKFESFTPFSFRDVRVRRRIDIAKIAMVHLRTIC